MRFRLHTKALLLLTLCAALPAQARKKHTPTSNVNFLVLRDVDGKPIRNAAVVMHPVNEDGKQARGGLELKTDPEGKANYDSVPYGKLRIQVLAPGFQTYGDDYDISQPNMEITVKMKRPAGQYSIYDDHGTEKIDAPQKPQ